MIGDAAVLAAWLIAASAALSALAFAAVAATTAAVRAARALTHRPTGTHRRKQP